MTTTYSQAVWAFPSVHNILLIIYHGVDSYNVVSLRVGIRKTLFSDLR